MKSFIKELLCDEELVNKMKTSKVNKEYMYNLLFTGRITLQEYLDAIV